MTLFQLERRRVLRVSGPEARSFLDNLLTQDVETLTAGARYAALLSPQGKVIADMIVSPWKDGFFLDAPRTHANDLLRRLLMYRLRTRVDIELAPLDVAWSPDAFDGAVVDPRAPDGALGWRAIAPASKAPEGDAELSRRLVAYGAPDLAVDARPEEIFAGEALLEELHGVDFQKGCFVGQENVSRMKRRATTRKKFCPIVFEGKPLDFDTPVLAGDVELGTTRSSTAGRAIALLRLDRAQEACAAGAKLTANGREVRLAPPPWLILPA